MKHITLGLTVAALWAVLATPVHAQSSVSDKIRAALQQTYRSDANRALDRSRNPVAAMIFCRLKDEMKVIVLAPGHGCYTELLGPVMNWATRSAAARSAAIPTALPCCSKSRAVEEFGAPLI